MCKPLCCLLMCLFMISVSASPLAQAFVSFSMPEQLLEQTLTESARLHIPAYLNGLYHNSMQDTAKKILRLTKVVPNLNLQIDPVAFERFGITKVPALVVSGPSGFDVIYGNMSLCEDLDRMASTKMSNGNESGLTHEELRRNCHV